MATALEKRGVSEHTDASVYVCMYVCRNTSGIAVMHCSQHCVFILELPPSLPQDVTFPPLSRHHTLSLLFTETILIYTLFDEAFFFFFSSFLPHTTVFDFPAAGLNARVRLHI